MEACWKELYKNAKNLNNTNYYNYKNLKKFYLVNNYLENYNF
jgi:hypothetical protein